jgi:hypothetical protein
MLPVPVLGVDMSVGDVRHIYVGRVAAGRRGLVNWTGGWTATNAGVGDAWMARATRLFTGRSSGS